MEGEPTAREAIAVCDAKNQEAGRIQLQWLQIRPEDDPNDYLGIHPESGALLGPGIMVGNRIKIAYQEPVWLPFQVEGVASGLLVTEITGTVASPCVMMDIEGVCCQENDHSNQSPLTASKSVLRVFIGDTVESI